MLVQPTDIVCDQNIPHLRSLNDKELIFTIHQGSGGLLRRVNLLAKGSLVAAAREKCMVVSAEHARMASTEIF